MDLPCFPLFYHFFVVKHSCTTHQGELVRDYLRQQLCDRFEIGNLQPEKREKILSELTIHGLRNLIEFAFPTQSTQQQRSFKKNAFTTPYTKHAQANTLAQVASDW